MPSLLGQFPMDDDFLDQVGGSLAEIEANLNRLAQEPDDAEALEDAYRHTHTISRSASLLDFPGLAQVVHAMEDMLGDALDEVLRLDAAAISLLRRSLFLISLLVDFKKSGAEDVGRLVAENAANHAAFRQQLEKKRFMRDVSEVREAEIWRQMPHSAMRPDASEGDSQARLTVHVRAIQGAPTAVGWAVQPTLTIDRPQAEGIGVGYSGGELLFLAIGACYCNDIFREADKRGITVKSVQVEVSGDWGGEPVRAQNVTFSAKVEAEASAAEIQELMKHTDRVAEISNSLRIGTPVQPVRLQAVPLPKSPPA